DRDLSRSSRNYRPCAGNGGDMPPTMSRRLPIIHSVTEHEAGPYRMEQLDLEFSNGERRRYERVHGRGHGAVAVVPMLDEQTVLLVREYAAGLHRYELGLVKGRIDAGETPEQAADRELKEEAGYGARDVQVLRQLTLAPTYMSHQTHLVLARDLYPERLPGDEPEELEVVPWRLDALHELVLRDEFSEGRSIAALFIVREYLRHHAGQRGRPRRGDRYRPPGGGSDPGGLRGRVRGRAQGRCIAGDGGGHGGAPRERRWAAGADAADPGAVGGVRGRGDGRPAPALAAAVAGGSAGRPPRVRQAQWRVQREHRADRGRGGDVRGDPAAGDGEAVVRRAGAGV